MPCHHHHHNHLISISPASANSTDPQTSVTTALLMFGDLRICVEENSHLVSQIFIFVVFPISVFVQYKFGFVEGTIKRGGLPHKLINHKEDKPNKKKFLLQLSLCRILKQRSTSHKSAALLVQGDLRIFVKGLFTYYISREGG